MVPTLPFLVPRQQSNIIAIGRYRNYYHCQGCTPDCSPYATLCQKTFLRVIILHSNQSKSDTCQLYLAV